MRIKLYLAPTVFMLFTCRAAFPSPTGLNNIPTAEVVPEGLLVWQEWSAFGDHRRPSHLLGFKYGPAHNWEVGLDSNIGPSTRGPITLQFKRRFDIGRQGLAASLGACNIASSTRRVGHWMPYAVLSKQLPGLRLHVGYSGQPGNEGLFAGADAPVGPGVALRADWMTVNDGRDSVSSLGFIWELNDRWLLEGWRSVLPEAMGKDFWIIKFNYVLFPGEAW